MAYSYSGIKEFETCPRKYYECKVIKIHPFLDSEATLYGKSVHEACEKYIRDGEDLGGHARFKPTLDALNNMFGIKHCELELGVDKDLEATTFDSADAFFRGIADLVIINDDTALIFDYKTGKDKYPDTDQLELMTLFIMAKYPKIKIVKAALLFLLYDTVIKAKYYKKDEASLWARWKKRAAAIEAARESDVWNEKPNGLCKAWCPCITCPHNGKNKL
jgi:hypothetical protein